MNNNIEQQLDHLDLSGYSKQHVALIKDIANCFKSLQQIKEENPKLSKSRRTGYEKKGNSMEDVTSSSESLFQSSDNDQVIDGSEDNEVDTDKNVVT